MGVFDTTSNSSTKAPNTGVQTGNAPGTAINLDLYKSNSSVNVNQVLTDHGAIDSALVALSDLTEDAVYLGERAVEDGNDTARESLLVNENVVDRVLDFAGSYAEGAAKLVNNSVLELGIQVDNALKTVEKSTADAFGFGRNALDTVGDSVLSVERIAGDSIDLAYRVTDLTEDINEQNIKFATEVVDDFSVTLADLDESRSQESSNVLAKVSELAQVVQTGGESINSNVNKILGVASIITVAMVAGVSIWRAGQ